jgi:tetratricopeptide (TPR) repeat protein
MQVTNAIIAAVFLCTSLTPLAAHETTGEESGRLGNVHFETSCNADAQAQLDRAVAALHSFYFGEAKKSFNTALEKDPKCGIGYWGLAMTTLGNLLVSPPTSKVTADAQSLLQKGFDVGAGSQRERDYISALQALFTDADTRDHRFRSLAYEKAMESLYQRYPQDQEAALFYALALNITALPTDKTYANQLKAADILDKVSLLLPDHPGVLHYLIHSLDYPALARRALPAAERYAQVAPAAPHALHMPSHTYSMLGEWEASIQSNRVALAAAVNAMARGLNSQPALNGATAHYKDFMIYAHLQVAQDGEARRVVDETITYQKAHDLTKDAIYTQTGFAAIPARYVLERKTWTEADRLETLQKTWAYAEAMTRFTRSLGASHTGDLVKAQAEIRELAALRQAAIAAKQDYWEGQIEVLRLAASAWLAQAQGQTKDALQLMRQSADLEDASEKHIAMENRLYPMRELLADLLLETGQPAKALTEYEASLVSTPNRFNGFYGAAKAAYLAGDKDKARAYYQKLLVLSTYADTERKEIGEVRQMIAVR